MFFIIQKCVIIILGERMEKGISVADFIENINEIKKEYLGFRRSFFTPLKSLENTTKYKEIVYSMNERREWIKDLIWEYMNDDIEYEELIFILKNNGYRRLL